MYFDKACSNFVIIAEWRLVSSQVTVSYQNCHKNTVSRLFRMTNPPLRINWHTNLEVRLSLQLLNDIWKLVFKMSFNVRVCNELLFLTWLIISELKNALTTMILKKQINKLTKFIIGHEKIKVGLSLLFQTKRSQIIFRFLKFLLHLSSCNACPLSTDML